jgi:hypothetical protein
MSSASVAWVEPSTAAVIRRNWGGAITPTSRAGYIPLAGRRRERDRRAGEDPAGDGSLILHLPASQSRNGDLVPPVCSNCGASDFVWANELKTGSIGGGSLSLRARGELPMGTRICRSCGHADLFLKDPSILRMPHTWKPGEFVPIAPRAAPATASAATPATSAAPAPVARPNPPPAPAPMASSPPTPAAAPPPAAPAPVMAPPPPTPPPSPEPAAMDPPAGGSTSVASDQSAGKKSGRRKGRARAPDEAAPAQ